MNFFVQNLREKTMNFVETELKKIGKFVCSLYSERSESPRVAEEVMDTEDEQDRSSREALQTITQNLLRKMKQDALADCLQYSKTVFKLPHIRHL